MVAKILALVVAFSVTVGGADWVSALRDAAKRVPRLEMESEGDKGSCSGVVINSTEGFILTAAHCVTVAKTSDISVTANDKHAEILKQNTILDLAIIQARFKGMTQVELADKSPEMGAEIAIVGYPFGAAKLASQIGHVAQPYSDEFKRMLVNADIIFGDSGGAVFNTDGELVGLTTSVYARGPSHLGGVVPVETIRDFVLNFLPKKP